MGRVATELATDLKEAVEDPEPPAEVGGTAVRMPAALPPEFADYVDFAAAGSDASGEFRCADCGYGVVVHQVLPACPMCRGAVWQRRAAPFAG